MPERLTATTPLPAVRECEAAIEHLSDNKFSTQAEAASLAYRLITSYPQASRAEDVNTYIDALEFEFQNAPRRAGFDAVTAVTRSCKFPPTVAELVEAIETARKSTATLAARARWALTEHERREREARREAELASITPERRAEMAGILDGIARKIGGDATQTA
jgi:hypothetical protein